jgi:long-chain acyl-CoA synthetase
MNSNHVSGLLDEAVQKYDDRIFLVDETACLTYGKVAAQSYKIAGWLQDRGIKRGDNVVIVTMNRIEVPLIMFAVARLGAVFTILNNMIKPHGLAQVLKQVTPALVFLDETTRGLIDGVTDTSIIWVGDEAVPYNAIPFKDILTHPNGNPPHFPGIDLDLVCLLYTSGSTGVPRGVMISHDNIRFSAMAIQERLGYKRDDVIGLFLPLSFDYGLYQIFLTALVGAAIYIGRPNFAGIELLRKLSHHAVSVLPGVPTLFAGLLKLLTQRPQPLPALRCVTNTGAHLHHAYIEQLQQLFPHLEIFVMYGLTECKRVSILQPDEFLLKPDSVGRPLTGTEVYVVDEAGQKLPPNCVGELVVRGRHVTLGYWQAVEETEKRYRRQAFIRELYSGDLCRIDAEGYLYFVERNDYQLKHKGFRIHPLEIETVACKIPGVVEAGVVKDNDQDRLHLLVTVANEMVTPGSIIEVLKAHLEPFKVPENVHIHATFPKTPNGKLDRKQLQQLI